MVVTTQTGLGNDRGRERQMNYLIMDLIEHHHVLALVLRRVSSECQLRCLTRLSLLLSVVSSNKACRFLLHQLK